MEGLEYRKVFGLGLTKTGTTSLGDALNTLGIRTIHYPHDEETYVDLTSGNYRLSVLEEYQGVVDISVAAYFAQLDKLYPGSKFILTIRDKVSWLKAIQRHWPLMLKWCDHDRQFKEFTEFINAVVFGTLHYNEGRFLYAYDTHLREVCDYFENRADDLLIMDICGGDGWEKLCPFLGVPVPNVPFPYLNKGKDKRFMRAWITEVERATDDIAALIPEGDDFILVDESRFGSKVAAGRRAIPFLERGGRYWGPPPDNDTAIREFERLRRSGANFIVFGWPAFWWIDYYAKLHRHLRSQFRCVLENDRLVAFDLRP